MVRHGWCPELLPRLLGTDIPSDARDRIVAFLTEEPDCALTVLSKLVRCSCCWYDRFPESLPLL
jgi:hypothetical protein